MAAREDLVDKAFDLNLSMKYILMSKQHRQPYGMNCVIYLLKSNRIVCAYLSHMASSSFFDVCMTS